MKKFIYLIMALVALSATTVSCNKQDKATTEHKSDSSKETVEQKDDEIAQLEALLKQVEEGFNEIAMAESRIVLERNNGESNKSQAIQEQLQFIKATLAEKQQTIEDLQQRINSLKSSNKADKNNYEKLIADYEKRINEFNTQVLGFQQYIADLEASNVAKDQTIAEQKAEIEEKQTTISEQTAELDSRSRTISTQDKALHTAYYVFGTKKELKDENILKDGEVLKQGNFNKDYFTEIDVRTTKTIKLYSKSAELKTAHPAGSYTIEKDANKQCVFRIVDADKFWSTSKYLVILVK